MEYEFRAVDKDSGKLVYGDLIHNQKVTSTGLEPRTMVGGYEVKPETVGLCSGLVDKNGKKIYAGDIIRWEFFDMDCYIGWHGWVKRICEVKFKDGAFRISEYPCYLDSCYDFDEEHSCLEVIGNIYENPELLKEKK